MSTIQKHVGNLLDVPKGIIVHGCNCQGVMGSGVALAIKKKWPEVYHVYAEEYEEVGYLRLGSIMSISAPIMGAFNGDEVDYWSKLGNIPEGIIVVNAMTQFDMAKFATDVAVDYDAITACFAQIKILAKATGLPVHFPLIGCGLANGDWNEVAPRIETALGSDIEKHLWVLE